MIFPQEAFFCHTPARVRWTSPRDGEIEIRGGLWLIHNIGRQVSWELRKNGKGFAGGRLGWGPTSATPQSLEDGSGGPSSLKTTVAMGDRIELVLGARDNDFAGVQLSITETANAKTWDLAADWSETENPNGPWSYHAYSEGPGQHRRRSNYCLFRPDTFPDIRRTKQIHYWGHYPVADLEYETDAPVQVGMRAWSPFLPGSIKESTIPAAVFEVHLRNTTDSDQQGTLAFNFTGPMPEETGGDPIERQEVQGAFSGVEVKTPLASYAVGTLDNQPVRIGADLGIYEQAWTRFDRELPQPKPGQTGTSAAVDFDLAAGQEKVVRFVLTWCAPVWRGAGKPSATSCERLHAHVRQILSGCSRNGHADGGEPPGSAKTHPCVARSSLQGKAIADLASRHADQHHLHLLTETGLVGTSQSSDRGMVQKRRRSFRHQRMPSRVPSDRVHSVQLFQQPSAGVLLPRAGSLDASGL